MNDLLRTRIADVTAYVLPYRHITYEQALAVADAVIGELGNLRYEPHKFQCGSNDCTRKRVIGDWEADDEWADRPGLAEYAAGERVSSDWLADDE